MRVRKLADFTGLAVASLLITQVALFGQEKLEYPESKQVNQVDNFFGTPVADPYRWLEDDVRNSESVREWVDSQNALTFSVIKQLPYRNEIKARLTKLWDYEKFGTPFKRGERYFYFKNNGLQNQSVLYKLKSLEDEPIVLIDPNQWSADGTNALG
eukprot:COSAG04_NODE_13294_length_612_cov_1.196881_1_plen_155_part_01